MPSDFDARRKTYSFGISREACEKRAIEGHLKRDPSVPGPGSYDYVKPIGSDSSKFSLRPRTSSLENLLVTSKNPGPGTYNPKPAIDKKGTYFLSKYKNPCAASFSPKTSARFRAFSRNSNPGPGSYEDIEGISREGFYYLTKYRSSGVRSFAHSSRDFFGVNREAGKIYAVQTPGPGSYRVPSEFGYYESKHKTDSVGHGGSVSVRQSVTSFHVSPRSKSKPAKHNKMRKTR